MIIAGLAERRNGESLVTHITSSIKKLLRILLFSASLIVLNMINQWDSTPCNFQVRLCKESLVHKMSPSLSEFERSFFERYLCDLRLLFLLFINNILKTLVVVNIRWADKQEEEWWECHPSLANKETAENSAHWRTKHVSRLVTCVKKVLAQNVPSLFERFQVIWTDDKSLPRSRIWCSF